MTQYLRDRMETFGKQPLSILDLSTRARRCLADGGYSKIGDLFFVPDYELLRVPGFGLKTIAEVRKVASTALAEFDNLPDIPGDILKAASKVVASICDDPRMTLMGNVEEMVDPIARANFG